MFKKYFNSLNTRQKILVSVLSVAFLAQVFTGILGYVSIMKCSYSVQSQSDRLGLLVKDNTELALRNQNKDMLTKSANQIAENADLLLAQTENKVQNLCNLSENAYLNSSENIEITTNSRVKGYVINSSETSHNTDNIAVYENDALPENLEKEFKILSNASNAANSVYRECDEISGIYIATETGIVYRSGFEGDSEITDPRTFDWYKKAKESAKSGQKLGVWNAPDSNPASDRPHITFSKAFFDQSGKMKGVVAIELYSEKICNQIVSAVNYDDKYVFVFDKDSEKPIPPYDSSSEFFKGFDEPSESYRNLILSLKNDESGSVDVLRADEQYFTAYAPIKKLNWSVGISERPKIIDSEGQNAQNYLMNEIESSKKNSGSDTAAILFQFLIIFCSFGVVVYALCRGITQKIVPDIELNEKDAKEFRKLKAELEMAEKVQKSMLPETTPSNLKRDDMEIYASSVPAEEVGGDFYDFFFVDENRLALVIADASDKGVPAALYMSAAKNLIKNKLQSTGSLTATLESVNNSLYEDNSMRMFVTAFVGMLSIKSGKFEFINAGHTPPLFYNHGKGSFDFMAGPHNCALGGIKNKKYAPGEMTIYKDDVLLLYTDGVTETANAERKLFSQEKLKELVNSENIKNLPIETLIETIRSEIKTYSGESGYKDDITLLGFRNLNN